MRAYYRLLLAALLLSPAPAPGADADRKGAAPQAARFPGQTFQVAGEGPESLTGLLVLDNRDEGLEPTSRGDVLSLVKESGEIAWSTTGFGICETVGGVHRVAVDSQRKRIYVAENVSHRVTALDFAGRRRLELVGMDASAVAVDERWGHLWVSSSSGTINSGQTLIFDAEGTLLNTLPVRGIDMVKASDSDAVWMSGSHLRHVNSAGKVLLERKDSAWAEPTLTIGVGKDTVWVGERSHPDVKASASRVRRVRSSGEVDLKVELPGFDPYAVIPDGAEGIWIGGYQGLRHVSDRGDLGPVIDLKVVALERVPRGDGFYAASKEEILKVSDKGEILSRRAWPRATTLLAR